MNLMRRDEGEVPIEWTAGQESDMGRYGLIESPFPLEREILCRPYTPPMSDFCIE
jgi:hypothetical protein